MRSATTAGMTTLYERFKTEREYHSAMYTMLHEIEASILRDYQSSMDDDYLRQTVITAVRVARERAQELR